MGFNSITKGDYFETYFTCDHATHYVHICSRCKTKYEIPTKTKPQKCVCGSKKFETPIIAICEIKTDRVLVSRIDGKGNKKKESDSALIKNNVGIDPDSLAGKAWYCPKHRAEHG